MKKKNYGMVIMSILLVWAVVGWMTFNLSQEPQPAVEYRAVCRNLPANAHWTSWGTRKEIPQTETSPNVWTPSPVGTYGTSTGNTECYFVCDGGFERDNSNWTCNKSSKWMCDMNAVCEKGDITIGNYTIKACNLGTSIAGTWAESYGCYFQWGNNYGFASTGIVSTGSNLVSNAIAYGPSSYYSGSTFITQPGVESASSYDYWTGGQNNNLRWGSGDIQASGRDSGNTRTERQWPCPNDYHVPSVWEWSSLVMTRWNTIGSGWKPISTSNGLPNFSDPTKATAFRNDFLLPLAGYRHYDSSATVNSQGDYSYYWSSSPSGSSARTLYLYASYVGANNYRDRARGFSLRCFKNS